MDIRHCNLSKLPGVIINDEKEEQEGNVGVKEKSEKK